MTNTQLKIPKYWVPFLTSHFVFPSFLFLLSKVSLELGAGEIALQAIIWSTFCLIGGLALKRKEHNWSVALFLLMAVLFGSAVQLLRAPPTAGYFFLIGAQASYALFSLLYLRNFFRYPYVDRRSLRSKKSQRHIVALKAEVFAHIHIEATVDDLSSTGAKIKVPDEFGVKLRQLMFVDVVFPELSGLKVKCRVMGGNQSSLRVKFVDLSPWEKTIITEYLSQVQRPAPLAA